MKSLIKPIVIIAMISMIVGGISRITLKPIIIESRFYAGAAALLLLLAIAIGIDELLKK